MPAPALIQAATLQRFILAWKKWDAQEWISTFSDDFEHVTLPVGQGIPIRSRPDVELLLPALVATVESYELTIRHVIHDPGSNKAAIYAVSKGNLPWGDWNLEYSAFVSFTEDGKKVARLEEMLDTAFLQDFGPKYEKYLQDNGGPVAVAARGS
ncbi:monooxygenase AgnL5 [Aspergillus viridinutans]|uniref:Monooxygenase AgnL5 n=1 Tax=Aspergillus viridinutans TaxID=75553 RepID=A0A9P3C1Y7_ASPVI|nr:monooxygenase AgnL5 [Aspergillus viridinutans]GIK06082.1 monooxygenase AgnL5 [Aspergillus viridinutans]